jgi:hypothetical protein
MTDTQETVPRPRNVSQVSVSRLVGDSSMCRSINLDKASKNAFCITAILRLLTKNSFSESFQRLIEPCRVL